MHFNVRSKAHRIAARMNPDELASIQAQASKDAAARQAALSAGKTMAPPTSTHNYPTAVPRPSTKEATPPPAAASKAPDTSKAIDSGEPAKPTQQSQSSAAPTAKVNAPPAVQQSSAAEPPSSSNSPSPVAQSTQEKEEAPPSSDASPSGARSPVSTPSSEPSSSEEDTLLSTSSSETRASSADRKLSSSSLTTSGTKASNTFKPQVASSAAATQAADSSSGMSGGAVAGIVIAVLLGVAAVGVIAAWYMRQKKRQEREVNNPWGRMPNASDDNITPFPRYTEKPDDYYGQGEGDAPVIGSNRALALARQNAFFADGSPRPDSAAMNPNFAGYGAARSYGPYPPAAGEEPFHPGQGYQGQQQQYQDNPFQDQYQYQDDAQLVQLHDHSQPRQLVGPGQAYGGAPMPVPAPVPLGRPEAPQTYDDIAAAEAYADDRYADDHLPAQQQTAMPAAMATGVAVGSPGQQQQQQMPEQARLIDTGSSDDQHMPDPTPLPQLRPMSPLMPLVDVDQQSSQGHGSSNLQTAAPVTAHHSSPSADEMDRMYNEVASYAGVQVADGQVQEATRLPPQPYVHGQPLAPLAELPTPKSETASLAPQAQVQPQAQAQRALPTPPQQQAPAPKQDEEDAYGGI